ncbi:MAG: hypothetical protein ACRCWB_11860 [Enterovibrio sp.]
MKLKLTTLALIALSFNASALTCGDIAKEKDDLIAAQMLLSAIEKADKDAIYDHVLAGVERIERGGDALGKIIAYQDMKERLIWLCVDKDRDLVKAITSKTK